MKIAPRQSVGGQKGSEIMKKKRYRAALALALVVLQLFCFFVPASAADETASEGETEGTWVEKSFRETTIIEDLGSETLEKYPLIESSDKSGAEIISAITRRGDGSVKDVELFLYIYVPSGTENGTYGEYRFLTGTLAISAADYTNVQALQMKKIDTTETLLKVMVRMTSEQYNAYLTKGKDAFQFYLNSFQITWGNASIKDTVTYDAVTRSLNGGKLSSGILLTASLDGTPMKWEMGETLELDVHLSAERYSTSESGKFSQINTAMFLVPTKYFYDESQKYLSLTEVVYEATYYNKVPFVVVDDAKVLEYASGDMYFQSPLFFQSHSDYPYWISSPVTSSPHPRFRPNRNFVFYREKIATIEGEKADVSSFEVISAFDILKADWAESKRGTLASWLKADNVVPKQRYPVYATEKIKTESYADGASFWTKLFDGRLFGKNEDDSIELAEIQTLSCAEYNQLLEVSLLTKEYFKGACGLSEEGFNQLLTLAEEANFNLQNSEYTIVMLHFSETEYFTYDLNAIQHYDISTGVFDYNTFTFNTKSKSYVFLQSIIDDFRIIQLGYENENVIKIVPVASPTYTFIGDGEGPDKIEDETYDPPKFEVPDWWPDFGIGGFRNKFKNALNKFLLVLRIILIVVIVVVLIWGGTKLFKFIGAARDAFGRRGGGKGGGDSG